MKPQYQVLDKYACNTVLNFPSKYLCSNILSATILNGKLCCFVKHVASLVCTRMHNVSNSTSMFSIGELQYARVGCKDCLITFSILL